MKISNSIPCSQLFLTFFVFVVFVVSINSVYALSFAQTAGFDEPIVYGDDGVLGYVRTTDTLHIEVYIDASEKPSTNLLRVGGTQFDSCEADISGYYLCSLSQSFQQRIAPISGLIRLHDNPNNDPLETLEFRAAIDNSLPEFDHFTISGHSGGVSINFEVSDEESGIKQIQVFRGSTSNPIPLGSPINLDIGEDGLYPKTYDRYSQDSGESLDLDVPDGDHRIFIIAKDAFDNEQMSVRRDTTIFSEAPVIKNWYVNRPNAYDSGYDLTSIGLDGVQVGVYIELDRLPRNDWEIEAKLTNFDISLESYKGISRPVKIHNYNCQQHNGNYLCRISVYDDDSSIFLKGDGGGQHSYHLYVNIIDDFGNPVTYQNSKTITTIDARPVLGDFYSLNSYGDVDYISKDLALLRLDFSSVADVSPQNAVISVSSVGGDSSGIYAKDCTSNHCIWRVEPSGSELSDGLVPLVTFVDDLGNSADFAGFTVDLVVNENIPELKYIKLESKERANNPDLYWAKNCFDENPRVECSHCIVGDPNSCSMNFWEHNTDYFLDDSSFAIELILSAGVNPSVTLELFDVGGSSHHNVSLSCEEMTENQIDDENGDGDSGEKMFICSNSGISTPVNNLMILHMNDVGGVRQSYEIPFDTYEDGGERDLWNLVEFSTASMVNRRFMSYANIPITSIYEFIPSNSNTRLLAVEPSCFFFSHDEDVGKMSIIRDQFGYNLDENYFLTLELRRGEVDDSHLRNDFARLNCTFAVAGEYLGTVYTSVENVVHPIEFYSSAWNQPSQEAEKEIEDILKSWDDYNKWVGDLARIINVLESFCGVYYLSMSVVLPVLAIAVDTLNALRPIDGGAASGVVAGALEKTTAFYEFLAPNVGLACDIISCRWCSGRDPVGLDDVWPSSDEIANVGSTGVFAGENSILEENAFCKEGGWLHTWLNNIMPVVQNLELGIMNRLDSVTGSEFFSDSWDTIAHHGGIDYTLDTQSSWYTAALTLCPTGILNAFERKRQIDCRYITCLQEEVPSGRSSVNDCKLARGYELCAYSMGGIWSMMPFSALFDVTSDIFEMFITEDVVQLAGLGGHVLCRAFCWAGTGCSACTITQNLFGTTIKLAEFYNFLTEGFDNFYIPPNACSDVDGMEPKWDLLDSWGW